MYVCVYVCTYVYIYMGFPCGLAGKESTCSAGDLGLIPGLGRSPGEGKGYPLQYSGLENSMDCIAHGVSKSWTRLSDFHFTSLHIYIYICGMEWNTTVLLIQWNTTQSSKKEWNNVICSNPEEPRDNHTKWSKPKREKQIPYDITYMWNLKYDTNETI